MSGYNNDTLATNLRIARARKNISQIELAHSLDVDSTTVSAWEAGKRSPGAENLFKLANALDATPNELLGWTA